jgi:hypothetical protein
LHPQAYVPLAIDIVFGFLAFIWFHWLR